MLDVQVRWLRSTLHQLLVFLNTFPAITHTDMQFSHFPSAALSLSLSNNLLYLFPYLFFNFQSFSTFQFTPSYTSVSLPSLALSRSRSLALLLSHPLSLSPYLSLTPSLSHPLSLSPSLFSAPSLFLPPSLTLPLSLSSSVSAMMMTLFSMLIPSSLYACFSRALPLLIPLLSLPPPPLPPPPHFPPSLGV